MLEPFAGIGIMVEDAIKVFLEANILPCVVAYELDPRAAKECQRRNPDAYVVNTDTFATPDDAGLEWDQHFMTHFIRKHELGVNEPRPVFKGFFVDEFRVKFVAQYPEYEGYFD